MNTQIGLYVPEIMPRGIDGEKRNAVSFLHNSIAQYCLSVNVCLVTTFYLFEEFPHPCQGVCQFYLVLSDQDYIILHENHRFDQGY